MNTKEISDKNQLKYYKTTRLICEAFGGTFELTHPDKLSLAQALALIFMPSVLVNNENADQIIYDFCESQRGFKFRCFINNKVPNYSKYTPNFGRYEPITCPTGEYCETYEEYLQSRYWKNVKRLYLERYGNKCYICGLNNVTSIRLHHLNYDNKGCENLDKDLIHLCNSCHCKVHGIPTVPKIRKKSSIK